MRPYLLAMPALFAAAVAAPRPALAGTYTIQTYTYAAADKFNDAVGITSSGLIVGNAARTSSSASTIDTSTSAAGPFTAFHPGTATNSSALVVSPSGLIAGNNLSGAKTVGFAYQIGTTAPSGSVTVKMIAPPSSTDTEPTAVSANGAYVAGYYYSPGRLGPDRLPVQRQRHHPPQRAERRPDLRDRRERQRRRRRRISECAGQQRRVRLRQRRLQRPRRARLPRNNPIASTTAARSSLRIRRRRDTFGFTYNLSTAQFTTFSVPGSLNTYVTGIDGNGDIIGYDGAGQAYVDAGGTLTLLTIAGSSLVTPTAILDNGTITGDFLTASNATDAFVATLASPVPEPGTMALLTLPVVLCLSRRRPR